MKYERCFLSPFRREIGSPVTWYQSRILQPAREQTQPCTVNLWVTPTHPLPLYPTFLKMQSLTPKATSGGCVTVLNPNAGPDICSVVLGFAAFSPCSPAGLPLFSLSQHCFLMDSIQCQALYDKSKSFDLSEFSSTSILYILRVPVLS